MEQPYYKYSHFLKEKYGEKTYKLPVNLPTTCPNRDGNLGTAGCYFCGENAADFEMLPDTMSVKEQLLENKKYIGERYGVDNFIAYFFCLVFIAQCIYNFRATGLFLDGPRRVFF